MEKPRTRKQVVKDCLDKGAMTETEAEHLNNTIDRADKSFAQGKMYIDLSNIKKTEIDKFNKLLIDDKLSANQKRQLHIMRVGNIAKPHFNNVEETKNAITEYFEIMLQDDMKPTMNGLSLALGISLKELIAIQNGLKSYASNEIIIKAIQTIATANEIAIRDCGGAGEMFLGKNYHGLQDKVEIEHTEKKADLTQEELEEKIKHIDAIDVPSKDKE